MSKRVLIIFDWVLRSFSNYHRVSHTFLISIFIIIVTAIIHIKDGSTVRGQVVIIPLYSFQHFFQFINLQIVFSFSVAFTRLFTHP